jgi:hypothetical protein
VEFQRTTPTETVAGRRCVRLTSTRAMFPPPRSSREARRKNNRARARARQPHHFPHKAPHDPVGSLSRLVSTSPPCFREPSRRRFPREFRLRSRAVLYIPSLRSRQWHPDQNAGSRLAQAKQEAPRQQEHRS